MAKTAKKKQAVKATKTGSVKDTPGNPTTNGPRPNLKTP